MIFFADALSARSCQKGSATEHLIQCSADPIDITVRSCGSVGLISLRWQIVSGMCDHPVDPVVLFTQRGKIIEEDGIIVIDEDLLQRNIHIDIALFMNIVQRIHQLQGDRPHALDGESLLSGKNIAQRLVFHILENDITGILLLKII